MLARLSSAPLACSHSARVFSLFGLLCKWLTFHGSSQLVSGCFFLYFNLILQTKKTMEICCLKLNLSREELLYYFAFLFPTRKLVSQQNFWNEASKTVPVGMLSIPTCVQLSPPNISSRFSSQCTLKFLWLESVNWSVVCVFLYWTNKLSRDWEGKWRHACFWLHSITLKLNLS